MLQPIVAQRKPDDSLYIEIRVFNLNEADGVLEVYDKNGQLVEFPRAVLGNRRIPDSVYELVVGNQLKVFRGLIEYIAQEQSPLDPKSRFQSRVTEFSPGFIVPPGGSFRLTKASPFARAYNAFFLGLDIVGYVDGPSANTISQRKMQDVIQTLATEYSNFVAESVATRSSNWSELAEFGTELSLKLAGTVLKPDNLDGRTHLGKALKAKLLRGEPYLAQLQAVATLGDFANWLNAFANLRAAVFRDTSIVINRAPASTPVMPPTITTGSDVKALAQAPSRLTQVDECILYKCGERHRTEKQLTVFAEPDLASSRIGLVPEGSEFDPLTAAYVTTKPEVLRVRARWATEGSSAYWYEAGDLIYLYTYWGEGCHTIWTRGYLYGYFEEGDRPGGNQVFRKDMINCVSVVMVNSDFLERVQEGASALWIKLKLSNGRIGWVKADTDSVR